MTQAGKLQLLFASGHVWKHSMTQAGKLLL
jgi:hemin uptake protein HemP